MNYCKAHMYMYVRRCLLTRLRIVDWEFFVVNKFSSVSYDDENKKTNSFQHRIIRMKLHFRYAEATKIK